MEIVYKKIDELHGYDKNARIHGNEQIQQIALSIQNFGFNDPIEIDDTNTILSGHGRLAAAIKLGLSEVPTITHGHMDDDQRKAYILAANRIAMNSTWDNALLKDEFSILKDHDFDLSLTGFGDDEIFDILDDHEINEGLVDADECGDVKEDVISKLGDVWILGNHRLMCGDSTSIDAVDKLMDDAKANFCFTSPPYSDQRDYSGNLDLKPDHIAKFISISSSKCDLYAVNLGISRKNNEVIPYWNYYIEEAKSAGLKLLSWNIWDRSGFGYTVGQATAMFTIDHEFIFVFGKDKKELNRTLENKSSGIEKSGSIRQKDGSTTKVKNKTHSHRQLGTVIRLDVNRYVGGDEHAHPATFPVLLPESYIEACTKQNENVYEPFGGSGSTLIACEKLKRKCFMMELDPVYCDVIIRRFEKFSGKKAILELTGEAFNG